MSNTSIESTVYLRCGEVNPTVAHIEAFLDQARRVGAADDTTVEVLDDGLLVTLD